MRRIEEVIRGITRILEEEKIDYVIVGGIAVAAWGNIRTTRDVDIILLVKEKDADELEEALRKEKFSIQAEDIRDALKERSHFTIFDELSEYYLEAEGIYVRQFDNLDMEYLVERCKKVGVYDEFSAMKRRVERYMVEKGELKAQLK